jgi:hypothetical protein
LLRLYTTDRQHRKASINIQYGVGLVKGENSLIFILFGVKCKCSEIAILLPQLYFAKGFARKFCVEQGNDDD